MIERRFASYPSLRGRKVIVTGGASGIGRAFVEAFVGQGADVAFFDINAEKTHELEKRLTVENGQHKVFGLECDVTDVFALRASVHAAADRLGGVEVLINNAADDFRHSFEELTPAVFDACIAINLKHQLFAAQAAVPIIAAAGGGSIICLGSIAWLNNTTEMIGYTIAKAGVHGLVRTLARQLGPQKIRVNALLPGWTMTERQLKLWVNAAAERQIDYSQCLPGRVMPDDVARMALFLAADDSAMITHQTFIVDGGWV